MIRLVELFLVLQRDRAREELVWADLRLLLERAKAMRFTYPAFEMAERLAPGTLDPGFRSRLAEAAAPRMRRVMAGLQPFSAHRFEEMSLDERLMWARGPVEHLRRALHMLWPAPVGHSLRALGRVYANRFRRIFRGRVTLRTSDGSGPVEPRPPPPGGGVLAVGPLAPLIRPIGAPGRWEARVAPRIGGGLRRPRRSAEPPARS